LSLFFRSSFKYPEIFSLNTLVQPCPAIQPSKMKAVCFLLALAASSVSAQVATATSGSNVAVALNSTDGNTQISVDAAASAAAAGAGGADDEDDSSATLPYEPDSGCTVTSTYPGVSTITAQTTSTYCPVCDAAKDNDDVYTTTYQTVYDAVCPTGLSSATYLVTATCTGTTPINYSSVPAGFVATVTVCTACAGTPTVTVTCPGSKTGAASPTGTVTYKPFLSAASSPFSGLLTLAVGVGSVFLGMLLL